MFIIAKILSTLIGVAVFVVFAQVVIHWLVAFEVIKIKTPQARDLVDLLNKLTDKLYRPLRKYIPPVGGIDITPVVVIVALQVLDYLVWTILV